MSIGSQEHAALALAANREYRDLYMSGEFGTVVDNGTWEGQEESWTLTIGDVAMLGAGSTRHVWTIDGEVAYKVNHGHNDSDNRSEWARYKKFHALMPEGTRLPEMSAYDVDGRLVLAVEIIKFPRQWARSMRIPRLPFEFMDDGEYNYRWSPDGIFIPIDFAC